MNLLFVGVGGLLGAMVRYVMTWFVQIIFPKSTLPIGTLLVNVIGSALIGVVFYFFLNQKISEEIRLFTAVGFLGSLTTFSTYTLDLFQLIKQGHYIQFILYFSLNNGLSFLALIGGFELLKYKFG